MKICFLSHITNYHTKKWCDYFVNKGHDVHVISFENGSIDGVTAHIIDAKVSRNGSDIKKLKYMLMGKRIKEIVDQINPDIINVHFATSYGIACALSGIDNYFLSVWGYDVYDFPKKSIFHKLMLKYSLNKATSILSTSKAMAMETNKYTAKHIKITPFGVDTNIFKPLKEKELNDDKFVIGTIKLLSPKYGIDFLLKAFKQLKDSVQDIDVVLHIAGNGPEEKNLKKLAEELGISEYVSWLGFISQDKVVEELNKLDVAVIPSILDSESFGVSAVEAQACEVPVVVTNVGGLTESTNPGESSIVVEPRNAGAIAKALKKLINDKELRCVMGKKGREYVISNFELNNNFEYIESIYREYLENNKA